MHFVHGVPQGRTDRCFPQGYISGPALQCKTAPKVSCG
jgi:hypothetical protein